MKKRFLLPLLASVILMSCLSGCNKEEAISDMTPEDDSIMVDTISAEKATMIVSDTFMGSVSAERELKVYPKTAGEVIRINVKPGDYVSAGDVLFQLNDADARLDLKSAESTLNKTRAEVKKSQGSDTVLAQQKEWQGLENQNSKIADSSYALNTANEDYNRQLHYLDEAKDKEDIAYNDYKKACNKYDKARAIQEAYEGLQAVEPAFLQVTLDAAAAMTPDKGPSQEHIDAAKGLLARLNGGEDDKLYPADVTGAGVTSLKASRDSYFAKYSELRAAREGQEDKVTSAKRTADKADKALQDNYMSYRQDVDNMMVNDIAVLEDNKRIQQYSIDASSIGVERAKQSLEKYTVTSPISGVIGKVDIREYETVSAGTEALLIENTDSMTVEFYVTEKVRNNLSAGQKLSVQKDDISTDGQIIEVAETADEGTGMFKIKALIPGSTGIMTGTRVSVTLDSYKDDSGFVIPANALYHSNGQEYIFVAQNGKAVRRNVVTGLFDSEKVVISEGLSAGESVITSWTSELKDGTKVRENRVENPFAGMGSANEQANTIEINEPSEEADALIQDETTEEAEDGGYDQSRVRATTTVFVRSAPDANDNGNKLGKAKSGDEFTALGEENGWTRVRYNDSEAYIKSDYLAGINDTEEE